MAEEEEGEEEQESEQDRLDILEARAKSGRLLLLVLGITSIIFMASLITGFITIGFKVSSTAQAPLQEMKDLSNKVTREFTELNMVVELHNHTMEEFGMRLNSISPNVDRANFKKLENILISQEKDYQYFLSTVKIAIHGLAEMVPGSRAWRVDFEDKLNSAINYSRIREQRISGDIPETEEPAVTVESQADDETAEAVPDSESMNDTDKNNQTKDEDEDEDEDEN